MGFRRAGDGASMRVEKLVDARRHHDGWKRQP